MSLKHKAGILIAVITMGSWLIPVESRAASDLVEPTLGEDGLYHQAWFKESFMDLEEDLNEARDAGKRLVLVFEQRGCMYCRKVHTEILADKAINDYVRENYDVLQLNLFGDREVTDFDGQAMPEKELGRKWGVVFTPTFVFMPESVEQVGGRPGGAAAVATMPGAFGKITFQALFEWVKIKGYEGGEHFQKYVMEKVAEKRRNTTN